MITAIIGIGAMATLFASKLAPHSKVYFVGNWKEQSEAIEKELTVINEDESKFKESFEVIPSEEIDEAMKADLVLIMVKSHQTERAAKEAKAILNTLSGIGMVVTMQNGIGNYEQIVEQVGAEHTLLATTTQGAKMEGIGVTRDSGKGPINLSKSSKSEKIKELFNKAGWEVNLEDNIEALVWSKLAVNAGINPLTAIMEIPNGLLLQNEFLINIVKGIVSEVVDIINLKKISIDKDLVEVTLGVAQSTSANNSSMLQAILNKQKSEIDSICGAIVREGDKLGYDAKWNKKMVQLIGAKERNEFQPIEDFMLNPTV